MISSTHNSETGRCDGPFVTVAVPLPLHGLFTYSATEEQRTQARFGGRVLVPFGSKILAGFVVGFEKDANLPGKIKGVKEVTREPPYFDEAWWRLIKWVADYYMLPLGLVLRTALPPGSNRKSQSRVVLTDEGRSLAATDGGDTIFPDNLLKSGRMPRRDLEKILQHAVVEKYINSGLLRLEEHIARPRGFSGTKSFENALSVNIVKDAPELTEHQKLAAREINSAIDAGKFSPFLLFGVTGSGKTEVYLSAIENTLNNQKRCLVLVPEIALTPQLARRFAERLGAKLGIFHSGFTAAQRMDEWRRVLLGEHSVIIAARSGIFLPVPDLGLIIVDEEHDPSYKQEDSCPYNARDMALTRGKLENACVILGSATPSFETFVNAQRGKITRLDLPFRHHGGELPPVEVIDLKSHKTKDSLFTPPLLDAIGATLGRGEQAIIFLNRRGFDTYAQCRDCAYVFKCPHCDVSLTHHKKTADLRCHICGYARRAAPICPKCSSERIYFGGRGTQKIEEELEEIFPQAAIERLDRDSTQKRENLESILDRFRHKKIDILTGTQMIVKGHDFPGISLVGILCGDASLHFPDFRAAERTFQMLTQVAGRTGRGSDPGKVILQTYDPDHQVIQTASLHAYERFFEYDSAFRRELMYPPYGYLILIRVEGSDEQKVESKAKRIGKELLMLNPRGSGTAVLGPAPSPRKKMIGRYRWQLLLKSASRTPIRDLAHKLEAEGHLKGSGVRVIVDVDPIDLM